MIAYEDLKSVIENFQNTLQLGWPYFPVFPDSPNYACYPVIIIFNSVPFHSQKCLCLLDGKIYCDPRGLPDKYWMPS